MNTPKSVMKTRKFFGGLLLFFGYSWTILWGLGLIVGIVDLDGGLIAGSIVLMILGIVCIILGRRIKRPIARFMSYVAIISTNKSITVGTLAAKMGLPADFVYTDLQSMINKGLFTNAHIDPSTGEIMVEKQYGNAQILAPTQTQAEVEMESFNCPACTAVSLRPKGKSGTCDYCGTMA